MSSSGVGLGAYSRGTVTSASRRCDGKMRWWLSHDRWCYIVWLRLLDTAKRTLLEWYPSTPAGLVWYLRCSWQGAVTYQQAHSQPLCCKSRPEDAQITNPSKGMWPGISFWGALHVVRTISCKIFWTMLNLGILVRGCKGAMSPQNFQIWQPLHNTFNS